MTDFSLQNHIGEPGEICIKIALCPPHLTEGWPSGRSGWLGGWVWKTAAAGKLSSEEKENLPNVLAGQHWPGKFINRTEPKD